MNKYISLIWLKWQTVYLWYCREASIVDNLKIQIMLYGVLRFPSFDVTSVDYSEVWWLYSSQSQSLLISPLSMWDESRLLGPFDLFVFFQLSCHFLLPSGFPEEKCQQLTDIVQTFDHHEFCYLFLPPKLRNTSPLGFLVPFLFYYSGHSFFRFTFRLFFFICQLWNTQHSPPLSTLLRGSQVHPCHHIHLYVDDSQMRVKKGRGRLVQQHFYSILQRHSLNNHIVPGMGLKAFLASSN